VTHLTRLFDAAVGTALMLALSLPALSAQAAAEYPDRPVRVVVPAGPGSPPDARARQIARKLEIEWRQPVVIENRPGAGGQIALEAVARAAPDGYTLAMAGGSVLTVMPHLRKQPYDPLKDFVPVAGIGYAPILLLVTSALPVTDAKQLVEHARQNPGKLNAASYGEGTTNHLALELFNRSNQVRITHVPYGDGSKAVTDLLGGHVQMAFDWLHLTRGHIRNGRLKALAVSGDRRLPSYPDIPTFAEAGIAGMDAVGGWLGFVAPAGTPKDIARKIHAAVARAFEDPEIRSETLDLGAYTTVRSPEEFEALIRSEHARWGRLIAEAGIRIE
jgi:tripartite-type tricarboxylate transporter receptor subunit TctC